MMSKRSPEASQAESLQPRLEPPPRPARPAPKRIGLQLKLVAVLLAIASVPLLVAALLIEQTGQIAHNFATNETAFLRPHLDRARDVYVDLIAAKRDLYYRQVALRASEVPELSMLIHGNADSSAYARVALGLEQLVAEAPELRAIEVVDAVGVMILQRASAELDEDDADWRPITIEQPIGLAAPRDSSLVHGKRARVVLTFAASAALQKDYVALQLALRRAERIDEVRTALPSSYRSAFWLLFGVVIVLISITGILLARRFTARIEALVQGTRRVSTGDLKTRVALPGRDELAELSWAFDRMVGQLDNDREQIAYLQRVGAWQDVARKLAHEIKNPLTPIQLAVQQLVSTYRGDEPRYLRTLHATEEIVTEEIASLRRLVDAFRTLGQLPPVEAVPLDLGEVVADLTKDPMVCDQLVLQEPDAPVTVRGDRMLLRRVLTNLVENGIHAGSGTGRGGQVVIRWRSEPREERALLWVDDEGPGVSDKRRDKIFEPYVTGKEDGTGLGLTICKKIVLEHQGRLRVAEEASSLGGARFVLTLPLADGESAPVGAQDK